MKHITALFLLLSVLISSCDHPGLPEWYIIEPEPLEFVCQDYTPVDTPSFIQGYLEMDHPVSVTGWVIHVGPYTDTIYPGQQDLIDDKLSLLINALVPELTTETYARADAQRISVMTKGTDIPGTLNWHVWIRAESAKWYMSFNRRTFYHGGAVDLPTWLDLCAEYPSMRGWHLMGAAFDSLGEMQAMQAIVDTCKLCSGCRADFRFNQYAPTDSITTAFDDASWNTIQSFAPGIEVRSSGLITGHDGTAYGVMRSSGVVDARGYRIPDEVIMWMLEYGHPVITDL